MLNDAENHWYFTGKVNFMLEICDKNLEIFKEKWKKFETIFPQEKHDNSDECKFIYRLLKDKNFLEFFKEINGCYCNCNFKTDIRSKIYGWFNIFDNKNAQNALKNLLDNKQENSDIFFYDLNSKCFEKYKNFFVNLNNDEFLLISGKYTNSTHVEYKTYNLLKKYDKDDDKYYKVATSYDAEKGIKIDNKTIIYKKGKFYLNNEEITKQEANEKVEKLIK